MKKYLLIFAILLCFPVQAHAGLFDFIGTVIVAVALVYLNVITMGGAYVMIAMAAYGEYKSEELRRQTEEARNRARDSYNASLKDRTVTNVATESPWVYIYGRARVGSSVVAILSSGSRDQYHHIIAIHAAHECDAFEEIYIASKPLGTLNADGFAVNSPDFSSSVATSVHVTGSGTTIHADYVPGSVIVYGIVAYTNEDGTFYSLVPIGFSQTGPSLSWSDTYPSGYRVEYSYKVSTVRVKKHLGVPGEAADATLIAECPGQWTANSKLSGFCYTYVRLDVNQQEFQGGLVGIEALLRGMKLYDPVPQPLRGVPITRWSCDTSCCPRCVRTSPLVQFLMPEPSQLPTSVMRLLALGPSTPSMEPSPVTRTATRLLNGLLSPWRVELTGPPGRCGPEPMWPPPSPWSRKTLLVACRSCQE